MERKLIITANANGIITTVIEDDTIVELHVDTPIDSTKSILGNIYIGKVRNIVSNIRAAFIEIAPGIECYYDMKTNDKPVFTSPRNSKKPLCIGDELLVQVEKEAVKTKVPTVTSHLNFPGRYLVLTTDSSDIGVSNKINKAARQELIELMKPYCTAEFGFIIRTNAQNAPPELITAEALLLMEEYRHLLAICDKRVCYTCVKQATAPYLSDIRNLYQEGLNEILVEDGKLYEEIKAYMAVWQTEDLNRLTYYQDQLLPLHSLYNIDRELIRALAEKVWLKSGAYLVIQPTEALTVIDVNTGKAIARKKDGAELRINLEAAKEAARQIRLRNLSGIILIDFINMDTPEELTELTTTLRRYLKQDPVVTTLVDVTKLQLVEITRKKVRKPLAEAIEGNNYEY